MLRRSVTERFGYGVHSFHRRFRLCVHRAAPTECGRGHGAVEQGFEFGVEFEHGDGRTRHIDGGHKVADQRLVDGNARLFQFVRNGIVEDVKFHKRGRPEAVDEHSHFVAGFRADVFKQVFNDTFCKFICRLELFGLSAGLAVNAHAELDFVIADVEDGRAFRGGSAAGERKAERTHVVDDFVRDRLDFCEGFALFRRGTRDFVHEHRARDASSADGVEGVLHRDVVVDVHGVHFDAVLVFGKLRRVVEVHTVAGIVLDDEEHALVRGAFLDGVVDLNLRRGGKHVAADRAVQHTFADETRVRGFVTGAAARDEGNFVGVDFFLFDYLVLLHEFEFGMGLGEAVAHIVDDCFGSVDYLFHCNLLSVEFKERKREGHSRFRP